MSAFVGMSAFAAAPTPVAASNVSISSGQETSSLATTFGKGSAVGGAVSGNYTTIQTGAQASPTSTVTTGTQFNIGGTVTGGVSSGSGKTTNAGSQATVVTGTASAIAIPAAVTPRKHG